MKVKRPKSLAHTPARYDNFPWPSSTTTPILRLTDSLNVDHQQDAKGLLR